MLEPAPVADRTLVQFARRGKPEGIITIDKTEELGGGVTPVGI